MNYNPFFAFDLLYGLVALLVVAAGVLLVVLLVRLMLAATRALNAITLERTVRLDLLLAEDDSRTDGDAPGVGDGSGGPKPA